MGSSSTLSATARSGEERLRMEVVAGRVRDERLARGLSLAEVAAAAQVSRSMLAGVERAQKVPTILLLDRIATALGTTLARLLREETDRSVVVLERDEQTSVADAGWRRTLLSPVLDGVEFEWMRLEFEPGGGGETFAAHPRDSHEYLVVHSGRVRVWLGDADGAGAQEHVLGAGDSCYFASARPHSYTNASARRRCVAYLAVVLGGGRTEGSASHGVDGTDG